MLAIGADGGSSKGENSLPHSPQGVIVSLCIFIKYISNNGSWKSGTSDYPHFCGMEISAKKNKIPNKVLWSVGL